MDNNVDTNTNDIDTIDINIDININDTNNIFILNRSIYQIKRMNFSIFDKNFVRFKVDRNNMLISSYFACTHEFDTKFSNMLS